MPAFPAGLVTDLFVGDCGGHGRALEALYETQRHRFETITNCVSVVVGNLKARHRDGFDEHPTSISRFLGQYYLGLGLRGLQQLRELI